MLPNQNHKKKNFSWNNMQQGRLKTLPELNEECNILLDEHISKELVNYINSYDFYEIWEESNVMPDAKDGPKTNKIATLKPIYHEEEEEEGECEIVEHGLLTSKSKQSLLNKEKKVRPYTTSHSTCNKNPDPINVDTRKERTKFGISQQPKPETPKTKRKSELSDEYVLNTIIYAETAKNKIDPTDVEQKKDKDKSTFPQIKSRTGTLSIKSNTSAVPKTFNTTPEGNRNFNTKAIANKEEIKRDREENKRKKEENKRDKEENKRDKEEHKWNKGENQRDKEEHKWNKGENQRDKEEHKWNKGENKRDKTELTLTTQKQKIKPSNIVILEQKQVLKTALNVVANGPDGPQSKKQRNSVSSPKNVVPTDKHLRTLSKDPAEIVDKEQKKEEINTKTPSVDSGSKKTIILTRETNELKNDEEHLPHSTVDEDVHKNKVKKFYKPPMQNMLSIIRQSRNKSVVPEPSEPKKISRCSRMTQTTVDSEDYLKKYYKNSYAGKKILEKIHESKSKAPEYIMTPKELFCWEWVNKHLFALEFNPNTTIVDDKRTDSKDLLILGRI